MNYLSILAVTVALFGSANVFAKQSWRTFDGSSCVDPAGNCYPIDIDIKGTKAFSANLAAFEAAVNSGTTKSYFSSEKWRYLFAELANNPKKLDILKSGISIYKIDRPNRMRFYIATRLSKSEIMKRIEASRPGTKVAGVEVCFPFRLR